LRSKLGIHGRGAFLSLINLLFPFECIIYYEKSLDEPLRDDGRLPTVKFKRIHWAEVYDSNQNTETILNMNEINFMNHSDCYVGFMDRLVFRALVSYNHTFKRQIFTQYPGRKVALVHRVFADPGKEINNIVTHGLTFICRQLQFNNIRKCYITTNFINRHIIHCIKKAGFSKSGYIFYLKDRKHKQMVIPHIMKVIQTSG